MSLAADGQDGNGLQLEKFRLNFSSCFHASSKNDINGCGLFSLCELGLYLPLDVQRYMQCSEWIKFATTNFRIWAKNLQNPCDRAPLTTASTVQMTIFDKHL